MFTHHLTEDEMVTVLRLLGNLAESDDHVSESEIEHLQAVAHEMDLSLQRAFEDAAEMSLSEICAPLVRHEAKVIAIMELMQLAFADRLVLDVERFKVRAIAEMLRLDPDLVDEIEDWVVRGRQWQAEGRELLQSDDDQ
jgi:uncharacterized membrane protein YebE (DUF533 family)